MSAGQQQYFRVKPQDTSVIEGQSVELQCRIGNQAGNVQWSKDGFVLGEYSSDIFILLELCKRKCEKLYPHCIILIVQYFVCSSEDYL